MRFKQHFGRENKISKIFRNRLFGVLVNIFYFSKVFNSEYLQ